MNSEEIIYGVSELLNKWYREETTSCCLYVKNSIIHCCHRSQVPYKIPSCLFISRWQLQHGLTNARWSRIATELLNLINKELACQAHQKH